MNTSVSGFRRQNRSGCRPFGFFGVFVVDERNSTGKPEVVVCCLCNTNGLQTSDVDQRAVRRYLVLYNSGGWRILIAWMIAVDPWSHADSNAAKELNSELSRLFCVDCTLCRVLGYNCTVHVRFFGRAWTNFRQTAMCPSIFSKRNNCWSQAARQGLAVLMASAVKKLILKFI